MTEEEIISILQILTTQQTNVIRELQYLIYNYPIAIGKFENLYELVSKIDNFDLSDNTDVLIDKLNQYSNSLDELSDVLGKNLNIFNIVESDQNSLLNVDDIKVTFLDKFFVEFDIPISVDVTNNTFRFSSSYAVDNLYYIKISQNMESTKILSDFEFTFYKMEPINNNSTKIILNVSDENYIKTIIDNNILSDKIVFINERSKYHIVRYGASIINNSKKLVLYIYPSVSDTIESVTFHNNVFNDLFMELNLTDFNMQDVSEFYFNTAERDLDSGEMVIYSNDNLPKHIFNFSIEDNKEKRTRNG